MKTGYKDRFGKDICVGHKLRLVQDGFDNVKIATVVIRDEGYFVNIPDYQFISGEELSLNDYIVDGNSDGWRFEIVEE